MGPSGPERSSVDLAGHAYTVFRRALELTLLIARKDARRYPRVAARWLLRYLDEDDKATIDELVFASSCLAALTGNRSQEAAQALRDMTEKATRRRRGRGVA